ncbi:HNH endonuclease [Myroides ceti]|uniref:HNH endonuclease n=1 Tax=Paenimyroides ceti TaxID=395087 RepID=A0ABT8D0I0_9FLAO|nr:HNH endonuclease [Paenimyroides ceti]MDN3706531.1 HNH endonuclease [Paenimyroides ceti]MDN3710317.1 HNH endonuclease [Paenimyroides ceti]MDN3710353.1 HNH endonuclease [Paenimyroides ceti]
MRNPRWHRDELILTLNLYFKLDSSLFEKNNPEVIELSKTLNKLPIYSEEERKLNFRNPNGTAMKLCNFMAIDPDNPNKGLTSFSKLDKETFFEFNENVKELERISTLIMESINNVQTINKLYKIEDEEDNYVKEGFEGEIIYKLHKARERDNKLTESKKKLVFKETGKLECEVCGFDFLKKYGELGKGFIECHHTKQLSTYETKKKTKLEDLALVCPNCHRMLHRNLEDMSIDNLKEIIKNSR